MISIYILQTLFFILLYLPGKAAIDLFNRFTKSKLNRKNSFLCIISTLFVLGNSLVLINFFLPINAKVQVIFFGLILFLSVANFKLKDKNLFYILIISFFLVPITLISEPGHDGGLYHIPFQTWIKQNEITLGLFNLHSRYALTSFHDYISALLTIGEDFTLNSFFQSSLILLFFLFFVHLYKRNNLIFFIVFPSLISFVVWHRYVQFDYSSVDLLFGFFAIFTIIKFIEITIEDKNKTYESLLEFFILISVTIMAKPTGIFFILLLPILIISYPKIKIIKNIKNYNFLFLLILLLFFWFSKNVIISGCLIYPIQFTCFNFDWFNQSYLDRDILLIQNYSENFQSLNFNHFFKFITSRVTILIFLLFSLVLVFIYSLRDNKKLPYFLLIFFSTAMILSISNESLKGFSNLSTLSNLSGEYLLRDQIIINEIFRIIVMSLSSIMITSALLSIIYKKKYFFIYNFQKKNLSLFLFLIFLFLIWFFNSPDPRLGFWIFALLPCLFCFLVIDNFLIKKQYFKFNINNILILLPLVLLSYFYVNQLKNYQNLNLIFFENKKLVKNTYIKKRKYFGVSPYIKNNNEGFNPGWNYCWNIKNCYYNKDEAIIKKSLFFKKIYIKN